LACRVQKGKPPTERGQGISIGHIKKSIIPEKK
jgi:hypothetical protein